MFTLSIGTPVELANSTSLTANGLCVLIAAICATLRPACSSARCAAGTVASGSSLGKATVPAGGQTSAMAVAYEPPTFNGNLRTESLQRQWQINREIEVVIHTKGTDFEIVIIHQGKSFDPSAVKPPDMKEYLSHFRRGGLGMHLMRMIGDLGQYKKPIPDFLIFLGWTELPTFWKPFFEDKTIK